MSLHVGNKVKIKGNNNKVYEISDISLDTADDNTPIKMYNLYDKEIDDILSEPFYEQELILV